MLVPADKWMN